MSVKPRPAPHPAVRPRLRSLASRLRTRLASLILDVDVEGAEVVAVLAVSLWGLVLSLPLGTFAGYPVYRQMATLAPQPVWAAGADLLALWQASALLAHSRRWRRRGLQVAAGWWMCLAVFVFRGAPNGVGWGLDGVLCGACAWAYWRIRREERSAARTAVPEADPARIPLAGRSVDCRNMLKCLQVLSLAARRAAGERGTDDGSGQPAGGPRGAVTAHDDSSCAETPSSPLVVGPAPQDATAERPGAEGTA